MNNFLDQKINFETKNKIPLKSLIKTESSDNITSEKKTVEFNLINN